MTIFMGITHTRCTLLQECHYCQKIPELIKCLQGQISLCRSAGLLEEDAAVFLFKLHDCHEKIWKFKLHLLRAHVQNYQFDCIGSEKDESTALATQDWAMKWLPASFRESQKDYFAKTGIPW